jgi:hypothetical protein
MGHFDESIFHRPNIEIDIAGAAKRIVLTETRERHDFRALRPGGPNAIQNIWRRSGRTDRDQHIASAPMPFNLTGEDTVVSEIISKACQGGAVAESGRPHAAVLGKIDRHMGGYPHAAAVSDEHHLVAALVGTMAEIANLLEGSVKRDAVAAGSAAFRLARDPE